MRSVGEDEGKKRSHVVWQVMVDFYSKERVSRRRKSSIVQMLQTGKIREGSRNNL